MEPRMQWIFWVVKEKIGRNTHINISRLVRNFHVHVDTSNVIVSSVLAQPYDDMVDHPNAYCWLLLSCYKYLVDLGLDLLWFQEKTSKTIIPRGKPEGDALHEVHCVVSPEIVLWVVATLRCLKPGNEWGFGIEPCDLYLIIITSIYYVIIMHACKAIRSRYFIKHSSKI